MDQFSVKAKTAVLTGAARGLGLAFATVLAESGANIAVLDIGNPGDNLTSLQKATGVKVEYYKTDVTNPDEVNGAIEKIEKDFGSVDININAAGIAKDQPFLETSIQTVQSTFNVNFVGSFLVAQACANAMKRKYERLGTPDPGQESTNGSIVFIASVATHIATCSQNISIYSASKAAVRGLVKPMAMELSKYGIRVNSLSPGPMKTAMFEQAAIDNPEFAYHMSHETMFGRVGNPDELKGAVLFLCSGASSWHTGQDLLLDGGASSWKHPAK